MSTPPAFVRMLLLLSLGAAAGCARPVRPNYSFDTGPGGWELAGQDRAATQRGERYTHAAHSERLEVFELARPAPAEDSAAFAALDASARALPPLGAPTNAPRALGDDAVNGTRGYWVDQRGRDDDGMTTAAVFVVPNGRRHFVARMRSTEDEWTQLQAWLRDILLRNLRFPPPLR